MRETKWFLKLHEAPPKAGLFVTLLDCFVTPRGPDRVGGVWGGSALYA